jgi:alginate O-acetyltransferase complex protein AlgI
MLFNSAEFCLLFFPLVTGLYFVLPQRWRWLLLLVASCWFYMAFVPLFILILAFTIGVDYVAGIAIERSEGPQAESLPGRQHRGQRGRAGRVQVLGLPEREPDHDLQEHRAGIPRARSWEWTFFGYWLPAGMVLPIGLSFHTFQSLSYTIEVYRGHQKAERRFGMFALYVMFYPQLVAGPIERPGNLLNQFNAP